MATLPENNTASNNKTSSTVREKAVKYINIALPSSTGKNKQLTSVGLSPSDPIHAKIIAGIDRDPETASQRLLEALVLTINDVEDPNTVEFGF